VGRGADGTAWGGLAGPGAQGGVVITAYA
jgi:hypothetical protein